MIKGKCPNAECQATLMIDPDSLLRMKRPVFGCPECDTRILIKPRKAKCGRCSTVFGYYLQTLGPRKVCKCPNNKCNALNRVN